MSTIRIEGEVAAPRELGFAELAALPGQVPDVAAVVAGRSGGGVELGAILAAAEPSARATHALLESRDGSFSACVPLAEVADAIVAYRSGDAPLSVEIGGPFRFLIPDAVGCGPAARSRCSTVKDIATIRLTAGEVPDLRTDRPAAEKRLAHRR